MKENKWEITERKEPPVSDGDFRIVNLPVKVFFEWSDKIILDYDLDTDATPEYTSGYVMKVLPEQYFIYKGEESTFISSTFKYEKK